MILRLGQARRWATGPQGERAGCTSQCLLRSASCESMTSPKADAHAEWLRTTGGSCCGLASGRGRGLSCWLQWARLKSLRNQTGNKAKKVRITRAG